MTSRALFDAAFTIPDPGGSASSGYFLSDEFYVRYQWGAGDPARARQEGKWAAFGRLTDVMPGLPDDYSRDFDAACGSDPAHIYLIKNGKYIIYDFARKVLEQSEPQPVCGDQDSLFGAVPAGFQVTGSVAFIIKGEDGPERACYLFGGRQVYRCNFDRGSAEGPYDITTLWPLLGRGFGGHVDYALPNPDASTLYLFGNNGTTDTYAETDPAHTAGDGTTGRNQPPTAFTNDTWRGMRKLVATRSMTFFRHGNMRPSVQLWGAGGAGGSGGSGAGGGLGGNGGGGSYITGPVEYKDATRLSIVVGGGGSAAAQGGNGGDPTSVFCQDDYSDPGPSIYAGSGGGGGQGGSRPGAGVGGDGAPGGFIPPVGPEPTKKGSDGTGERPGTGGRGADYSNPSIAGQDASAGQTGGGGGWGGDGFRHGCGGTAGGQNSNGSGSGGGGGGAGGGTLFAWTGHITAYAGQGRTPAGTNCPDYVQGVGVGGAAGQPGSLGEPGGPGLVVVTW